MQSSLRNPHSRKMKHLQTWTCGKSGNLDAEKLRIWNWTKSEAFKLAHKDAGQHKDLYIGAPDFEGFEKVL